MPTVVAFGIVLTAPVLASPALGSSGAPLNQSPQHGKYLRAIGIALQPAPKL